MNAANRPPRTALTPVTSHAAVRLAPNPGPMTLDGTNSYVLSGNGGRSSVIVDPGPGDPGHLDALAAVGDVELILITHRHHDHTEGAAELAAATGAPVRAADPAFCRGGEPLRDGELVAAAGLPIEVLATPGHTADSVCFRLPSDSPDRPHGAVLTGDTILGRGTTVIAPPDGSLGDYLGSLRVLAALGRAAVLPAHGPQQPDLQALAAAYLAHREQRLDQIRAALVQLGADADVAAVTDFVYHDVDVSVRRAAEHSVAAQLGYLRAPGGR
ncbi:MBL fold metallo-hydrolase [Nakamurella multipartita]|uniref:Beta-lactamase domain protein n=1 Tax=Nakamurella multipartita (strain ATCC 700099 / DSM 44233 / CIP 104796 / JCM 9543 / NBRC 105858 / Y-104) TaxID=479431 RepID=C8X962_NAKMY|nr:MBL fold metallo-hydrolase [Nakamurella multipartita]ACV77130.1 beta-lactamase domain protein [Nakamurella multipartita DSM 44233]